METRAKITNKDGYKCYIMGQLFEFAEGDIVEGRVAEFALTDRAGSAMLPEKKAVAAAPENKAKSGAKGKK